MSCFSGRVCKVFIVFLLFGFCTACFKSGPVVTQAPISISISSTNASLTIGQSATIDATVYDQSGQGVTWSASPVNFGALSKQAFDASTNTASVVYTAPAGVLTPTTVTITATSIYNTNIAKSISFHFSPVTVSIQDLDTGLPFSPQTLNPGSQINFLTFVANDLTNSGVTWSVNPANVGVL